MTERNPADVQVTQADRDLVYSLMFFGAKSALERQAIRYIRDGKGDDARAVQEVARHRIAALQQSRSAVIDECLAAVSGIQSSFAHGNLKFGDMVKSECLNAIRALSQESADA